MEGQFARVANFVLKTNGTFEVWVSNTRPSSNLSMRKLGYAGRVYFDGNNVEEREQWLAIYKLLTVLRKLDCAGIKHVMCREGLSGEKWFFELRTRWTVL